MFKMFMILAIGVAIGHLLTMIQQSLKHNMRHPNQDTNTIMLPWKLQVSKYGEVNTDEWCDIVCHFKWFHKIENYNSNSLVTQLTTVIKGCYKYYELKWNEETPFRRLCRSTTLHDWKQWREDQTAVLKYTDLLITASLLELFIHQSIESNLSNTQKTKLSSDIKSNIKEYPDGIRDIMLMISVALDYDDMLQDYSSEYGEYVNYDCIMWGCKKVMELISIDIIMSNRPELKKQENV